MRLTCLHHSPCSPCGSVVAASNARTLTVRGVLLPAQVYYYNTVSEESAWERPPDFKGDTEKVAEQPVPSSSNVVLGTAWSEVKCLDGRVYFYNSESEVWVCGVRMCVALWRGVAMCTQQVLGPIYI